MNTDLKMKIFGMAAAALGLVYRASRVRASRAAALALLLAGLMVVEPRAIPRPHLVSFAGLAFCLLLIEKTVATGRVSRLWWSIPIVAVWSNLHVEAAFAPVVIGIFALTEFARPAAFSRRDARQDEGAVGARAQVGERADVAAIADGALEQI